MARKRPKTVPFGRRRVQKTNYVKRLKLLVSQKPRLVVRFTNTKIIAQIVLFNQGGDRVAAAVDSSLLRKEGWAYSCKNLPAAYLTGLLLGKKAIKNGQSEAILDTGFREPIHQGKLYAFLRGALDGGLKIPHGGDKIFPPEERMFGKHIEQKFAQYLKSKSSVEEMQKVFEKVKEKINGQ